jgi:delta 1-pyrroline-5-carboxylate dehydrogenase
VLAGERAATLEKAADLLQRRGEFPEPAGARGRRTLPDAVGSCAGGGLAATTAARPRLFGAPRCCRADRRAQQLTLRGAVPVHQPVEFSAGDLYRAITAALMAGNAVVGSPRQRMLPIATHDPAVAQAGVPPAVPSDTVGRPGIR